MQAISLVTLGISDLARARRFYEQGFGWSAVFEMDDVAFYQMNGLVFGLWSARELARDMGAVSPASPGGAAYAHNVGSSEAVDALIERLCEHDGTLLRKADAPPHGGYRGYVADPDGHVWEIAWNPAWTTDAKGHVTFGT